ncbi:unnamed protein product [Rhodiola kirilowii]
MGSLKESLNQFKRQQEKCQSMLTGIAAKATPKNAPTRKFTPPVPSIPKGQGPPLKFSNDTERLQQINNIRKSSVGLQIKRVIDFLYETRKAVTAEEINAETYVDMKANKAVFDSLKNNPKVLYDGTRFSYKAKHEVKEKNELLRLIRTHTEGIAVMDLKDSYPNVEEDLQVLKASGDIWLLCEDSKEEIAYPNDPRVVIKPDDDLKVFFRSIELPRDFLDIEKDLTKNGMKPVSNTAQRRAKAQNSGLPAKPKTKKKKHEISKRTKLTNAHLPELFQNLNNK